MKENPYLTPLLEIAVSMKIAEYRARGGPTQDDHDRISGADGVIRVKDKHARKHLEEGISRAHAALEQASAPEEIQEAKHNLQQVEANSYGYAPVMTGPGSEALMFAEAITTPGDAAYLFNLVADGLAVVSFQPGGLSIVKPFGLTFNSSDQSIPGKQPNLMLTESEAIT